MPARPQGVAPLSPVHGRGDNAAAFPAGRDRNRAPAFSARRSLLAASQLEDVAQRLAVYARTLNRRLQAEGSSFRRLLNGARSDVARQLFKGTRMDVATIAHVLGYADSSSFSHAFRG